LLRRGLDDPHLNNAVLNFLPSVPIYGAARFLGSCAAAPGAPASPSPCPCSSLGGPVCRSAVCRSLPTKVKVGRTSASPCLVQEKSARTAHDPSMARPERARNLVRALHALWRSISSKKPYRMRAVAARGGAERRKSFVRASGCVSTALCSTLCTGSVNDA
jgi:hypothetical protein